MAPRTAKRRAPAAERMTNSPPSPISNPNEPRRLQQRLTNAPIFLFRLKNEAGTLNWIFCSTMGAATDLVDEDLRWLLVNGVFWRLGLEVPGKAEVPLLGAYEPSKYGFDGFKVAVKPEVFEL